MVLNVSNMIFIRIFKINQTKYHSIINSMDWSFCYFLVVKKDTLKLYKYEETLLLYYKKYLQRLEKFGYSLIRKKGQTKHLSEVSFRFHNIVLYFELSHNLHHK